MKRYISLFLVCVMLFTLVPITASASSTMKASGKIMDYIKEKEGCVLTAYQLAGEEYYTIGYGHYGPDVSAGMTISQAQADSMFAQDLKTYEAAVNVYIDNYNLTLNQNQFDALVSFTYNCGIYWVDNGWRLSRYLKNNFKDSDGKPIPDQEIADAFGVICSGGSGILTGLIKRRIEEAKIFLYGDYAGTGSRDFVYMLLNANGGNLTGGNRVAIYTKGQPYGAMPEATRSGYYLYGWKSDGGSTYYPSSTAIAKYNLNLTAVWKEGTAPTRYLLTVNGGFGSGKYTAGTKVCISPAQKSGYDFTGWSASGVTISKSDGYYYFTMPSKSVTITAQFESQNAPKTLTVNNGSGSGKYASGTKVYVDPVTKPGYCFVGWKADGVTVTYDKSSGGYYIIMPSKAVTITAMYQEGCIYGTACPSAHFTDVSSDHWGHEGIDFCINNKLLVGTSSNTFNPEDPMTRGMVVTVLYRLAGKPSVKNISTPYSDVFNEYYRDAALWAHANHITADNSYGLFLGDEIVSREEFALMLMRYAGSDYLDYDVDNSTFADLSGYTDAGDISPDCRQAMSWAVDKRIIIGITSTTLEPTSGATRAQVSTMLLRFMQACLSM